MCPSSLAALDLGDPGMLFWTSSQLFVRMALIELQFPQPAFDLASICPHAVAAAVLYVMLDLKDMRRIRSQGLEQLLNNLNLHDGYLGQPLGEARGLGTRPLWSPGQSIADRDDMWSQRD